MMTKNNGAYYMSHVFRVKCTGSNEAKEYISAWNYIITNKHKYPLAQLKVGERYVHSNVFHLTANKRNSKIVAMSVDIKEFTEVVRSATCAIKSLSLAMGNIGGKQNKRRVKNNWIKRIIYKYKSKFQ